VSYKACFWFVEEVEYHGVAEETGEKVFINVAGFGEVGERD
jgi:hypothetical protein